MGHPGGKRGFIWILTGGGAVLLILVLWSAWICDDAYITFRTVDNWSHGLGLRWNAAERVQTYTHPLWMLSIAALYSLTGEAYYTSTLLSVAFTLLAVAVLGRGVARSVEGMLLGLMLLALSKAFIEYSASGLENPLSHALAALFLWRYFRAGRGSREVTVLILISTLAMLNRMDTILLYLPALLARMWTLPKAQKLVASIVGGAPMLAWVAFTLFYYGAPFPNSAYAKLGTGISSLELAKQGLGYFLNSLSWDPVTLLSIGGALLCCFTARGREQRWIGAGTLLYLAYIVRIGGDFMSGRFFSLPLVFAVAMWMHYWHPQRGRRAWLIPALALGLGLPGLAHRVAAGAEYGAVETKRVDRFRITNERYYYYPTTGLLNAGRFESMPAHADVEAGKDLRRRGPSVALGEGIGLFGYYAGPGVHLVDQWAVGDPLLARLPMEPNRWWRIGHFSRELPTGYIESLETGENRIVDPCVRDTYDTLRTVVRGPLFASGRLAAIWRLNTAPRCPATPRVQ